MSALTQYEKRAPKPPTAKNATTSTKSPGQKDARAVAVPPTRRSPLVHRYAAIQHVISTAQDTRRREDAPRLRTSRCSGTRDCRKPSSHSTGRRLPRRGEQRRDVPSVEVGLARGSYDSLTHRRRGDRRFADGDRSGRRSVARERRRQGSASRASRSWPIARTRTAASNTVVIRA